MIIPDSYPSLGRDDVYVITTRDGSDTLFNHALGAAYHSLNGAVGESRHVFIQHGLNRISSLDSINILEIGFGTGLNAFLAFLFSQKLQKQVSYTGIESFPIDLKVAIQLNYPSYLAAEDKKEVFFKMHEEDSFTFDQFNFHKLRGWTFGDNTYFDCIFFDAFAPGIQQEIWEQNIFRQLYQITSVNGILVTYCAQGEVRRSMQRAGFQVSRIPGAPGKREMLQARKPAI